MSGSALHPRETTTETWKAIQLLRQPTMESSRRWPYWSRSLERTEDSFRANARSPPSSGIPASLSRIHRDVSYGLVLQQHHPHLFHLATHGQFPSVSPSPCRSPFAPRQCTRYWKWDRLTRAGSTAFTVAICAASRFVDKRSKRINWGFWDVAPNLESIEPTQIRACAALVGGASDPLLDSGAARQVGTCSAIGRSTDRGQSDRGQSAMA